MEENKVEITENPLGFFDKEEIYRVEELANSTLEMLSRSRSFFKKDYLIHSIKKKVPEEIVLKPKFDALLGLIVSNMHVMELDGNFNYAVLVNRKMLHAEKEMIAMAMFESKDHVLDRSVVEVAIKDKVGISEEQIEAVWASCGSEKRVSVIEGTAGAGKSFTMMVVKESYENSGYAVTGTALSWNAAKVLEESAGLKDCKALEGLLREIEGAKKQGLDYFRVPTVLIIDEAGLIGTMQMWKILKETHNSKMPVKIVLSGDSDQLAPVEAGNALEAIVEHCGSTRIDTIRRQKIKSHRKAVKLFSAGKAGRALYTYIQQESVKWCKDKEDTLHNVISDFISYKLENPNKKALILALSNKDVQRLNLMVREAYKRLGKVKNHSEITLKATDMRQSWDASFAPGDMVVIRKNDKNKIVWDHEKTKDGVSKVKDKGLFNRMSGVITAITKNENRGWDMIIDLENNGGYVEINTDAFSDSKHGLPICHNFATTIYASQGQTVDKVFLIDSDMMQRRLAYVGMSRHTDTCDIYLDKEELHQRLDKLLGFSSKSDLQKTYSKKEMLQAVAFTWGKEAKNQTAMVMLKERKEKRSIAKEMKNDDFVIQQDEGTENVLDFIYEINKDPSPIDLNILMSSVIPLSTPPEIAFVKASDVIVENEIHKFKYDNNLLNTLQSMFSKKNKINVEPTPVEKIDIKPNGELGMNIVYINNDNINVKVSEDFSIVFRDDNFSFDSDIVKKYKGIFWDIGRNCEPRIIASHGKKVYSRYSFDGDDKTGEGFPPILFNKFCNKETPVLLFKNIKDLFLTLEHFVSKYGEEAPNIPHMVFLAKDLDYNLLVGGLKKRNVVIARSKIDVSQIDWALDVQDKLKKLSIFADITPKIDAENSKKIKISN